MIKTLPGSEDCAWTPEGILLSASGAKLYQWNPKDKKEWVELVNLEKLGYKNITRLAVSPKSNRLAFVANDQSAN